MRNPKPIFTAEAAKHAEIFLLFFLCGLGVLCGNAFCDDLRFRFQTGDKFFLTAATEQKVTRMVDGNEMTAEQSVRLGCDLDIAEVLEDGNAWAKYTYRTTAMQIKGPGVDVAFDSNALRRSAEDLALSQRAGDKSGSKTQGGAAPSQYSAGSSPAPSAAAPGPKPAVGPASPAAGSQRGANPAKIPAEAAPLALVLGETLYVKITPQGRIDKINGLREIVNYAKGKMPNSDFKTQVIQGIAKQFDEAVIKRTLESQFAVFPDACSVDIKVGDKWSRGGQIDENSVDEPVSAEQTFRLKERRPGGIAVIEVNIVVRPSGNIQKIVVDNVKARREVRGLGSGQIEIEESDGRIINSTLTQDLIEETKLSPQGMMLRIPPNPEPARTHIVMTFQMTRREEEPGPKPAESNRP